MGSFVVGITDSFFDATGEPNLSALRGDWLGLPADFKVIPVPNGTTGNVEPESLRGLDAFIMGGGKFDAYSLGGNDRLLGVFRWGVGYDTVNLDDCAVARVVAVNAPEGVKKAMAHTAISLVLALAHQIPAQDRFVRSGESWASKSKYLGPGLVGKTLGVVGLGNIGREIVRIAEALDCTILGYDPYAQVDNPNLHRVELDELMRKSDFIIIQCALTPETTGLISAERLALMKPSAYLVNTARGAVVDEPALIAALQNRVIAGAGLDVFAKEPCPADNPLLQMNNVIVAPHSLGWTDYFALTTAKSVADGILATYNGEMPVNTVNRRQIEAAGVLPRLRHRKG